MKSRNFSSIQTIIILVLLPFFLTGAELQIASKGTSNYQIAVCDLPQDAPAAQHLTWAAKTLQKGIMNATGAKLAIVKESQRQEGVPAILIGNTKKLNSLGLSTDKLGRWEHRILVKDKDILLFGHDLYYPLKGYSPKSYRSFELGSLKAVFCFLEKFVSTEVVSPMNGGFSTLPMESILVPEDFSYGKIPQIQYCVGRSQSIEYDLANNMFPSPWYGTYGGHSHNVAIPQDKYFESHPEYFALLKGKRTTHPTRPQYCLSNPEVQELIYQELLTHLDRGFGMVQLGQSDGFRACECDNCKALFNVESFGDKLWILHKGYAERLTKDRPGKSLCVMAYGPTIKPPSTFKEFPENMTIELAPFNDQVLADWKDHKVPGGFVVYLYNWGWYQLDGFTPKRTAEFLTAQTGNFHKNNVLGVYCCGFGELMGLEGPAYFQWLKQLDSPETPAQELRDRYCKHAFRSAAPVMSEFYKLLDQRTALDIDRSLDWNSPDLLDGTLPAMHDNMRILAMRYPADVIAKLDSILAKAEAMPAEAKIQTQSLQIVRYEFDHLKLTATAISHFELFRKDKSDANFNVLAQDLVKRADFISGLPVQSKTEPKRIGMFNNLRLFGCPTVKELMDNGRLRAPLMIPFTWDAKWMLDNKIKPAGRIMHTGDAPQLLVQKSFYTQEKNISECPVSVSCTWDEKSLLVDFTFANVTQEDIRNNLIQVILGFNGKRLWFPGRSRNGHTNLYQRVATNLENNGKGDKYEQYPKVPKIPITAPVPGKTEASARIAIPWDTIPGFTPAAGAKLEFNVFASNKESSYAWEQNIMQKSWRNMQDAAGVIILK